jgi:formylmethanofuran dehydrogenase subunit E
VYDVRTVSNTCSYALSDGITTVASCWVGFADLLIIDYGVGVMALVCASASYWYLEKIRE